MLKRLTKSPYLNILSGLILLITAGYETWDTFAEASIGAHHGLLIFSIIHIVRQVPEIVHGLKEFYEADDLMKKKITI